MKKKLVIGFIVLALIFLGFAGCDLLGGLLGGGAKTAPQRVDAFIADVKAGNWTSLQDHFYGENEPADYTAMNDSTYWDGTLFYDADDITVSGDPTDTATSISATLSVGTNDYPLTFTLKANADGSYFITRIDFTDLADDDDVRKID